MFPGRYTEIFGRSERLGCVLNFDHSLDAIEAYFNFTSMLITLDPRPLKSPTISYLEIECVRAVSSESTTTNGRRTMVQGKQVTGRARGLGSARADQDGI